MSAPWSWRYGRRFVSGWRPSGGSHRDPFVQASRARVQQLGDWLLDEQVREGLPEVLGEATAVTRIEAERRHRQAGQDMDGERGDPGE